MGRRAALLVASVAVAALGVGLIGLYVHGADRRAAQGADLIPVLVTKSQVPEHTAAAEIQTVSTLMLRSSVPQDAFVGTDALEQLQQLGKTTSAPIQSRTWIRQSDFGGTQASTSPVAEGMVAVSVQLSDPQRAANMLRPGDEVAVWATGTGAGGVGRTRALLPKVKVLAIGGDAVQTADGRGGADLPSTVLMLELKPEKVPDVIDAQGRGAGGLTLTMLGPDAQIPLGPGTASTTGTTP